MRFCGNFYFNSRYRGFKTLSGLWLLQPLGRGFRWKKECLRWWHSLERSTSGCFASESQFVLQRIRVYYISLQFNSVICKHGLFHWFWPMMRRLCEIPCRLLARTALQPRVLVDLIQCVRRRSQFQEKHLFRFPQLAQRVVQDNQSPNERTTGSVTEFFSKSRKISTLIKVHDPHTWRLVSSKYNIAV